MKCQDCTNIKCETCLDKEIKEEQISFAESIISPLRNNYFDKESMDIIFKGLGLNDK